MKRIIIAALLATCIAVPAQAQFSGNNRVLAAPNMSAGQVAVATTATLVVPQRDTRQDVVLNVTAANSCAVGSSGVTLTTGYLLPSTIGASVTVHSRAAIYMVCASTTTVSFVDDF